MVSILENDNLNSIVYLPFVHPRQTEYSLRQFHRWASPSMSPDGPDLRGANDALSHLQEEQARTQPRWLHIEPSNCRPIE